MFWKVLCRIVGLGAWSEPNSERCQLNSISDLQGNSDLEVMSVVAMLAL
jgi:hypothetical protein